MPSSVGETISGIRKRLGKTMVEFARLIGAADHSIVSKYEAGQVPPSKSMLILLLLLARGDEKTALLDALGVGDGAAVDDTFQGGLDALLEYDHAASRTRGAATKDAGVREFVREAAAIAALGVTLDPAIAEVLHRLRSEKANRQIQAEFRKFLAYLDIAMAAGRPGTAKASGSRKRTPH